MLFRHVSRGHDCLQLTDFSMPSPTPPGDSETLGSAVQFGFPSEKSLVTPAPLWRFVIGDWPARSARRSNLGSPSLRPFAPARRLVNAN